MTRSTLHRHRGLAASLGLATMLVVLALLRGASAQPVAGRGFPPLPYYSALSTFHTGDFKRALDAFTASGRMGYRVGNQRWADSICYHTMRGECFLNLGQLEQALDQYNQAGADLLAKPQLDASYRVSSHDSGR